MSSRAVAGAGRLAPATTRRVSRQPQRALPRTLHLPARLVGLAVAVATVLGGGGRAADGVDRHRGTVADVRGRIQPQRATAAEPPRARVEPRAGGHRPLDPDAAGLGRRAGRRHGRRRAEISCVHGSLCGSWPPVHLGIAVAAGHSAPRAEHGARRDARPRVDAGKGRAPLHAFHPAWCVEPHGLPRVPASCARLRFQCPRPRARVRGLRRKPASREQTLETGEELRLLRPQLRAVSGSLQAHQRRAGDQPEAPADQGSAGLGRRSLWRRRVHDRGEPERLPRRLVLRAPSLDHRPRGSLGEPGGGADDRSAGASQTLRRAARRRARSGCRREPGDVHRAAQHRADAPARVAA